MATKSLFDLTGLVRTEPEVVTECYATGIGIIVKVEMRNGMPGPGTEHRDPDPELGRGAWTEPENWTRHWDIGGAVLTERMRNFRSLKTEVRPE